MHSIPGGSDSRPVVVILVAEDETMPPGLESISEQADIRLARTDTELGALAGEAEVICIWDFRRSRLAQFWDRARQLRWIHASSAGVDAVLFDELAASQVVVTNTRGVLDDAITEYVLGAILALAKGLPTSIRLQQQRQWRHRDTERIAGRRMLVLGVGSIGKAVGRMGRGAGMVVEGLGSKPRAGDDIFEWVVGPADLDEALSRADFTVACLPLTAQTRGMIGPAQFAAMAPGARFINVARGPVVDEAALVESLRSGRLAGAALDVFAEEPLPKDHPFWEMEQVIVTAHQAGDFIGWEQAFSQMFVENFGRYRRGEQLLNVVDKARMLPPAGDP